MTMKRFFLTTMALFGAINTTLSVSAQNNLPGLTYSNNPAVVDGFVKNFSQLSSPQKTIYVSFTQGIDRVEKTDSAFISDGGEFALMIPVEFSKIVTLRYGERKVEILVTPGEILEVAYDPRKDGTKKNAWTFRRSNPEFNRDLANYGQEYNTSRLFFGENRRFNNEWLKDVTTVEQYKARVLGIYNDAVAAIDANTHVGNAFKEYVKNSCMIQTLVVLTSYAPILGHANHKNPQEYKAPADYYNDILAWNPFSNNNVLYSRYVRDLRGFADNYTRTTGAVKARFPESFSQLSKACEYSDQLDQHRPFSREQIGKVIKDCPVLGLSLLQRNAQTMSRPFAPAVPGMPGGAPGMMRMPGVPGGMVPGAAPQQQNSTK